ncbi:MAG TPA: PAS domain S-box protein, partial [Polyangiaceae bacterium]
MTPLEDRVQRAEVALVYEQARAGFAISLFNGLVFFVLLRDVTPRAALWAWLAFLVAVSVARAVLVRAHSRATAAGPIDALAWRRRFVASAFVGGTVWGSLALLLFPSGSLPHQLAIGFVIAGLAAGAVSYFSSVPGAYYAFALSALIPYAVRLLFVGGALPTTLAFLSLIYTASLAINVRRVHIVIRGSFRARFANEALVEQMRAEVLEREAAQERLAASEERFRGAFESVSVGMALLDEGGRFLLVNRALCSMLGYAETELLSRFFDDFLVGDESPDIHDRVASTSTANGPDVAFEERLLTKDGQERWMEGGMRAVRGARGERRFVAQLADVTERRAL